MKKVITLFFIALVSTIYIQAGENPDCIPTKNHTTAINFSSGIYRETRGRADIF